MDQITLPVESRYWDFRVSNERQGHRRRPESEILGHWVGRWHRRSHATLTRDPEIVFSDQLGDDFIRNLSRYRLTVHYLRNGQDYDLPERLLTNANALVIEAVNGRYFDRVKAWEHVLGRD